MRAEISFYDENDDEVSIPARWEVCPRCKGTGTHDAWSGGMTAGEMYEQGEEFIEDYFAGRYDVTCDHCGGRTTVAVPDTERCTSEQLAAFTEHERLEWEYRAEREAEIRAGC